MGNIDIMSIRFLGGQIGEALNENHLIKMKDIVGVEIKDLVKMFTGVPFAVSRFLTNDVEKAQWLKTLAVGICMEECAEKGPPASVGGCKTFKKVTRNSPRHCPTPDLRDSGILQHPRGLQQGARRPW